MQQLAIDVDHLPGDVYLVIADLLDAVEYKPPGASANEIHRRAGTRPAPETEVARFHQKFGPFDT